MALILVLYLVIGLLSILISIPLIMERIRPNLIYGFRVRATLDNPEIWYAVNKHFGKRFMWSGIVTSLTALISYNIPGISLDMYALGCLAVFVVTSTLCLILTAKYLQVLTRSIPHK